MIGAYSKFESYVFPMEIPYFGQIGHKLVRKTNDFDS